MKTPSSGQIRIIGGKWRSRKLEFPAVNSLRPSPDSVRETLFNWLQSDIKDSRCLDLFCGSGAFGFEALSRGALEVVMVESNSRVVRQLIKNRQLLESRDELVIEHADALRFLQSQTCPFDIVFADPPFDERILQTTCEALASSGACSDQTLLYLESARSPTPLPIPETWHIIRQKVRGRVQSTLLQTLSGESQTPND